MQTPAFSRLRDCGERFNAEHFYLVLASSLAFRAARLHLPEVHSTVAARECELGSRGTRLGYFFLTISFFFIFIPTAGTLLRHTNETGSDCHTLVVPVGLGHFFGDLDRSLARCAGQVCSSKCVYTVLHMLWRAVVQPRFFPTTQLRRNEAQQETNQKQNVNI